MSGEKKSFKELTESLPVIPNGKDKDSDKRIEKYSQKVIDLLNKRAREILKELMNSAKIMADNLEKRAKVAADKLEDDARVVAENLENHGKEVTSGIDGRAQGTVDNVCIAVISSIEFKIDEWLKSRTRKLAYWLLFILSINMVLSCFLVIGSWIFFKQRYFNETPNQQKFVADMAFNGYRMQDLGNNKQLLNANDPVKKAYILDFNTHTIIDTPELRTDPNHKK